ncbi:hypothetical protein TSUD_132060 [Trifolium subterraneum]|uniref:Uncharacterized protein n=1 Tax=Trifolium subterraneum TaxID=3900 RepID=A0A2Z6LKN2_TRISU|nr:hypothetical protein TSUD_132060 [Trifolium subterraneum]
MAGKSNFHANLPILDGKNWDTWVKQMNVIFIVQEADEQKSYGGDAKVKKVKLQALKRQFELLEMKNDEAVAEYFTRVETLTNQMKNCGSTLSEEEMVEKVLRTLTHKFDHIVVTIEQTRDLSEIKMEDLQSTLEAHELKHGERNHGKEDEQALFVKFKKYQDEKKKWQNKKGSKKGKESVEDKPESSKKEGGGQNTKKDKSTIKCYSCNKYGHYAITDEEESEAHMIENDNGSDQGPLLMMPTTEDEFGKQEGWYLDTCCSNHMTSNKEWLVNYDSSKKSTIQFADSRTVKSEGIGDMLIKGKDGNQVLITGVMYVPDLPSNILSIEQLVEKGFTVSLGNNQMEVYNVGNKMVFCASLSQSRIVQVKFENSNSEVLIEEENDKSIKISRTGGASKHTSKESDSEHQKVHISEDVIMNEVHINEDSESDCNAETEVEADVEAPEAEVSAVEANVETRAESTKARESDVEADAEASEAEVSAVKANAEARARSTVVEANVEARARSTRTKDWNPETKVEASEVEANVETEVISTRKSQVLARWQECELADDNGDVKVLENESWDWKQKSTSKKTCEVDLDVGTSEANALVTFVDQHQHHENHNEEDSSSDEDNGRHLLVRTHRTTQIPRRLADCDMVPDNIVDNEGNIVHYAMIADTEPLDVKSALKSKVWLKAIIDELKSIEKNKTWDMCKLPSDKRAIDVKWVYKLKQNPEGQVIKHKARLVAKGFLQKQGLDYDEVFSPVARHDTIRLVIALACSRRWPMFHLDVKSAFLNGSLEEDVYVKQPPGFELKGMEDRVLKLNKAFVEYGVYVKHSDDKHMLIICLYVDDLLVTGSSPMEIENFKSQMKTVIPADTRLKLEVDGSSETVDSTMFRQLLGSLRYLCQTRPDISYAVGYVSRFMSKPLKSYLLAAKRILRYINGTIHYGVLFPYSRDSSKLELNGFSDADWCGDKVDRRSTSGYVFKFQNAPVSWCSKKQSVIVLSSCEAEYVAGSLAACQANWLQSLLSEMKITDNITVMLKIDNKSAINLAKNHVSHGKSKHIETMFHFLRDQVNKGKLSLEYCSTNDQHADILTKAVKGDQFLKLRREMGIVSFDSLN